MGELDSKYIEEALHYKKKAKNSGWFKWGAMVACFTVVTILCIGVFQSGLIGDRTEIVTLDNGNEIVFVKSDMVAGSLDIAIDVTTRQLTEEEITIIFPNLPVTANAIYSVDNTSAGGSKELVGFEGNIENVKMVISTSDVQLLDAIVVGNEASTEVNGTNVTAGYFMTDPNSKGERYVIYYATFQFGDSTVYVENAGAKSESERVKNVLAAIIQQLIENGPLHLDSLSK